jgi:NAD(P)-dependent dehydrogenase (short-subunit alcohol dehydrogenase family)
VGGGGGIGSAVVARYLDAGVHVAVVDKERPRSGTSSALYIPADVTQEGDLARVRGELDRLGWAPAHLVSLAGGALDPEFGPLVDTDAATIRSSVELNLTSHILLVRELLQLLDAGDSAMPSAADRSITLVSSINALRDYGLPSYSAAKAGMFGFVRAMASELGAQGIRINAVVPGTVMTSSSTDQPKDFEALRRGAALGRLASAEDVAEVIVALSHSLTAVTGQLLVVDCGQTVATPTWRAAGPAVGRERPA